MQESKPASGNIVTIRCKLLEDVVLVPQHVTIASKYLTEKLKKGSSMRISQISGNTMRKVAKWMIYHHDKKKRLLPKPIPSDISFSEIVGEWDGAFIGENTLLQLIELTNAADFLKIKELQNLCCSKIAQVATNLFANNPQEFLQYFGSQETLSIEL